MEFEKDSSVRVASFKTTFWKTNIDSPQLFGSHNRSFFKLDKKIYNEYR